MSYDARANHKLRQERITELLALMALFHPKLEPQRIKEDSYLRSVRGLAAMLDAGGLGGAVVASLQESERGFVLVLAMDSRPGPEVKAAADELCRTMMRDDIYSWGNLIPFMLQWQKTPLEDFYRPIHATIRALPAESIEEALRVYTPGVDKSNLLDHFIEVAIAYGFLPSDSPPHSFRDAFVGIYQRLESVCERLEKVCDGHTVDCVQACIDFERLTKLICYPELLRYLDFDGDQRNVNGCLAGKAGQLQSLLRKFCSHTEDVCRAINLITKSHARIQHEWVDVVDLEGVEAVKVDNDLLRLAGSATSRAVRPETIAEFNSRLKDQIALWKVQEPINLVLHAELRLILHCEKRGMVGDRKLLAASRDICLACAEWIFFYNDGLEKKWEMPKARETRRKPRADWKYPARDESQPSSIAFTLAGWCIPISIANHAKKVVDGFFEWGMYAF